MSVIIRDGRVPIGVRRGVLAFRIQKAPLGGQAGPNCEPYLARGWVGVRGSQHQPNSRSSNDIDPEQICSQDTR